MRWGRTPAVFEPDGRLAAVGGGGLVVGSSYLRATHPNIGGESSGSFHVPWVLDDAAGSDLTIDGADATLVNVLTSGWYTVMALVNATPNAATLQHAQWAVYEQTGSGTQYWDQSVDYLTPGGSSSTDFVLTTEPAEWLAGQKIQTELDYVLVGGGTLTVGSPRFSIVRHS